jgi:polyhydroxyalkanoate synthase
MALPLGDDLLDRVSREVQRTAVRARNGLKYATGSEWAPVSPTPRDRIWSQGPAALYRYRNDRVTLGPPVLMFIGLVSRAHIFDLHEDNSVARRLGEAGFDVYVLDWGEPGPQDATNTLETYVTRYLPRAVAAMLRESGSSDCTMFGYCMGGNFALLAAAEGRLPIRNLVTMATPIDMSRLPGLAGAVQQRGFDPASLIDHTGNVPAQYMAAFFRVRKPTSDIVAYANLWENLWNDKYIGSHQAMARWAATHVAFPGGAFRQVHQQWLVENAFVTDRLRLRGRALDLKRIISPTLSIYATRDDLIAPEAAIAIEGLLGSEDFELLAVPGGHAGLTASRNAVKTTFPVLIDWLTRHSDARSST